MSNDVQLGIYTSIDSNSALYSRYSETIFIRNKNPKSKIAFKYAEIITRVTFLKLKKDVWRIF